MWERLTCNAYVGNVHIVRRVHISSPIAYLNVICPGRSQAVAALMSIAMVQDVPVVAWIHIRNENHAVHSIIRTTCSLSTVAIGQSKPSCYDSNHLVATAEL